MTYDLPFDHQGPWAHLVMVRYSCHWQLGKVCDGHAASTGRFPLGTTRWASHHEFPHGYGTTIVPWSPRCANSVMWGELGHWLDQLGWRIIHRLYMTIYLHQYFPTFLLRMLSLSSSPNRCSTILRGFPPIHIFWRNSPYLSAWQHWNP